MTAIEQALQDQLDDANRRIALLEQRAGAVTVTVEAPTTRNALQSISDWWNGGSTAGARSRHMRVNY